jgi:hypothetical protein
MERHDKDKSLAKKAGLDAKFAITVAQIYVFRMLQRTLPAGFIAPCLPTKTTRLPSGSQWLYLSP